MGEGFFAAGQRGVAASGGPRQIRLFPWAGLGAGTLEAIRMAIQKRGGHPEMDKPEVAWGQAPVNAGRWTWGAPFPGPL
ncbi:hypothetical protein Hsero_0975 [Herbaspirillum seropedicae SmR1]|uniref:Uncharacterized protein n=1 Tax=Herbaspirillum seropedicae (strain SmR1) TaxID=757424 RepID=D8J0T7_HERSS|nr:hypothetical protein Hsero_0975 [Herbaspirillum seropedicae SmR1]